MADPTDTNQAGPEDVPGKALLSPEQLEKYKEHLSDVVKLLGDAKKIEEERKKIEESLTKLAENGADQITARLEVEKLEAVILKRISTEVNQSLKSEIEQLKHAKKTERFLRDKAKRLRDDVKANKDLTKEQKKEYREMIDQLDAEAEALKKISTRLEPTVEAIKEAKKEAKLLTNQFEKLLGLQGGPITSFFSRLNIDELKDKFKDFESLTFFKTFATTAGANLLKLPAKLIAESADILLKAILEQQKIFKSVAKQTGDLETVREIFPKIQEDIIGVSLETERYGQAIADLTAGMSNFSNLSKDSMKNLSVTIGLLDELGFSAGDSIQSIDSLTRSFGLSTDKAKGLLLEMMTLSKNIGAVPAKMARDFAANLPKLAHWGDRAKDEFKKLAIQSKATGMAMESLLGIAEKFDTLTSAVASVGSLNAILGGPYLNTVEMINASETDRINILKEQISLSGKNFEAMGRYEKKAIASQLGVSAEELGRLMKMNSEELLKYNKMSEASADSQKDLKDRLLEMQPAWDKFQLALRQIAVSMLPVLEIGASVFKWIGDMANAVNKFAQENKFLIKIIGVVAGTLAMVFMGGWIGAIVKAISKFRVLSGIITTIGAGLKAIASKIGLGSVLSAIGISVATNSEEEKPKVTKAKGAAMEGAHDVDEGVYLVGERGPELVTLPPHANVITNQNTQKIVNSTKNLSSSSQTSNNFNADAVANKISSAIISALRTMEKTVVMQVDEKKFAQVVVNMLDKRYNIKLAT